MIQRISIKQPAEKWYVPFDFSGPLSSSSNPNASEEIGSISSVSARDLTAGEDATSELIDEGICQAVGQVAYVWVQGGTSGRDYKITCQVTAETSGQVFELEAYMKVLEQ